MLRAAILCAALASTSAFSAAPLLKAGSAVRSSGALSGMKMQAFWVKGDKSKAVPFLSRPEKLDGTLAGDVGFDPLGLSNYWDIKWMRESELKHGRICMLATAGILVQEFVHLPGAAFSKKVALEAWSSAPRGGMIQILVAIGLIELVSNRFAMTATDMFADPNRKPGNLGFDPLNLSADESALRRYELAELKHSRLAMIAIGGFVHQAIITKTPVLEQLANFQPIQSAV
uniref:Uncharacterized protein n=1 Tax=Cryptomonas curvata TaxID=233186 RepID=A0A7S0QK90_9CRYP